MIWWFALTFIIGVVAGAVCIFAVVANAFRSGRI